jgi:hypothetical protein
MTWSFRVVHYNNQSNRLRESQPQTLILPEEVTPPYRYGVLKRFNRSTHLFWNASSINNPVSINSSNDTKIGGNGDDEWDAIAEMGATLQTLYVVSDHHPHDGKRRSSEQSNSVGNVIQSLSILTSLAIRSRLRNFATDTTSSVPLECLPSSLVYLSMGLALKHLIVGLTLEDITRDFGGACISSTIPRRQYH